jgi:hypothetical protein
MSLKGGENGEDVDALLSEQPPPPPPPPPGSSDAQEESTAATAMPENPSAQPQQQPPREQPELSSPPTSAVKNDSEDDGEDDVVNSDVIVDKYAPPPDLRYDGTARAVDYFRHPYFEDRWRMWGRDAAAERSKNLGEVTLGVLLRQCFRTTEWYESVREPLGEVAQLACARMPRAFYDRLVPPDVKRDLLASALQTKYGCDFRTCVLPATDVQALLLPLLRTEAANEPGTAGADADAAVGGTYSYSDERVIDLSLLDRLKDSDEEEFFVTDKLYVRDAMRCVFGLFQEDARLAHEGSGTKEHEAAALSGSAGVGKAVLFFLAALHRATFTRVAYYRRRPRDDRVSFFLMEPVVEGADAATDDVQDDASGGGGIITSVRIWFTRNVDTYVLQETRGLCSFSRHILDGLTLENKELCTFLDGPRMKEEAEDRCGRYNYICTNGPRFYKWWHYETRLWLLGGWSQDDARQALRALGHDGKDAGRSVFELCGGNIRDMVDAAVNYEKVKARLDRLVDGMDKDSVTLVAMASSSHRPDSPRNRDRLRIVFEGGPAVNEGEEDTNWKTQMGGYEVVDSQYLLRRMLQVLDLSHFIEAYRRVNYDKKEALCRLWFTRLVHKCAKEAELDPQLEAIDEVYWSSGSRDECVRSLSRPSLYWIPSDPDCPNVDSALVVGVTLYVFHTGMQGTSVFDESELRTLFVSAVAHQMPLERVVVCFVYPQGSHLRCHNLSTIRRCPTPPPPSKRKRRSRRSGGTRQPRPIPIVYGRHRVCALDQESCSESLMGLFRDLGEIITYF